MTNQDRAVVLETIRDLEGWSGYIIEVLTQKCSPEPATVDLLERTLGREELRRIREVSWPLFDQLHRIRTVLELSSGEPVAGAKTPV
jgi:hypothetical protein